MVFKKLALALVLPFLMTTSSWAAAETYFPDVKATDPDFQAISLPVTRAHLRNERLGAAFIDYMNTWKGFVAEEEDLAAAR